MSLLNRKTKQNSIASIYLGHVEEEKLDEDTFELKRWAFGNEDGKYAVQKSRQLFISPRGLIYIVPKFSVLSGLIRGPQLTLCHYQGHRFLLWSPFSCSLLQLQD